MPKSAEFISSPMMAPLSCCGFSSLMSTGMMVNRATLPTETKAMPHRRANGEPVIAMRKIPSAASAPLTSQSAEPAVPQRTLLDR